MSCMRENLNMVSNLICSFSRTSCKLPLLQYSVNMHWFGGSMQAPMNLTMWSFCRSRIWKKYFKMLNLRCSKSYAYWDQNAVQAFCVCQACQVVCTKTIDFKIFLSFLLKLKTDTVSDLPAWIPWARVLPRLCSLCWFSLWQLRWPCSILSSCTPVCCPDHWGGQVYRLICCFA